MPSPSKEHYKLYASAKISKIRFLNPSDDDGGRIVSGTWDNGCDNMFTLWNVERTGDGSRQLVTCDQLKLGTADVSDIFPTNSSQFVSCLNDGSVKIIDCTPENRLAKVDSFIPFRRKTALTSVCVLNETIISGSDTGSIVSIAPSASRDQRSKVLATDLMGVRCLAPCGLNIFVSGHSTGQIHMWDLREEPASPGLPHQPVITKAITSLNNSITSLGTHTAQPNILAVGTGDGSVIFVDIRHTVEALPVALKVSKEPIDEIKFHPLFGNNCFSSSVNSVIHWDASAFCDDLITSETGLTFNASQQNENMAIDCPGEKHNVWLSGKAWSNVNLKALVEDDPLLISTFDVSQNALVVGSNTCSIVYKDNLNFID